MQQGQIISLGSINTDFQVRTQRWPEPGETLLGDDFLLAGGGKAANVALLAHRLGAKAQLIGHIGDDTLAEAALDSLRAEGIDLSTTKAIAGTSTGASLIVVRPDGDKTIILAANANDAWTTADADDVAAVIAAAPPHSLLVADLEVPAFVVQRAAETARQRGLTVVLDPSPADRLPAGLYPLIDYITPNPSEAHRLTGRPVHSVQAAARAGERLLERGVGTAVVKLGDGGCVVVSETMQRHIRAIPVEAVDKTGAGDAFAGALSVALLEGQPVADAAQFAVAAAHLAVSRYGSQPAYPTRDELEDLLARWPRSEDEPRSAG